MRFLARLGRPDCSCGDRNASSDEYSAKIHQFATNNTSGYAARCSSGITAPLGNDADGQNLIPLRFLNPMGGNPLLNDPPNLILEHLSPERFTTFLSRLPPLAIPAYEDGVITALGRPVRLPELFNMVTRSLAVKIKEKKDQ
jgi:hypothetical protein